MVIAQEGVNVGVEGLHLEINASTAIKLAIGKFRCEIKSKEKHDSSIILTNTPKSRNESLRKRV